MFSAREHFFSKNEVAKLPSLIIVVSSAENVTQRSSPRVVNIADYCYDMCRNECAPRKTEQNEVDFLPNVLLLRTSKK